MCGNTILTSSWSRWILKLQHETPLPSATHRLFTQHNAPASPRAPRTPPSPSRSSPGVKGGICRHVSGKSNGQRPKRQKTPKHPRRPPPTPLHTTPPPGATTLPPKKLPTPTAYQHWGQGGWEEGQNSYTPVASPHSAGGTATSRPLRPQTSNNAPRHHRTQRTCLPKGVPHPPSDARSSPGVKGGHLPACQW